MIQKPQQYKNLKSRKKQNNYCLDKTNFYRNLEWKRI